MKGEKCDMETLEGVKEEGDKMLKSRHYATAMMYFTLAISKSPKPDWRLHVKKSYSLIFLALAIQKTGFEPERVKDLFYAAVDDSEEALKIDPK